MPAVTIPDRICSHCGGTEWYVLTEKSLYVRYRCTTRKREEYEKMPVKKRLERQAQRYQTVRENPKKEQIRRHKKFVKFKQDNQKYAIDLIRKKHLFLKPEDIPQSLIELKIKQLQLTRHARQQSSSN